MMSSDQEPARSKAAFRLGLGALLASTAAIFVVALFAPPADAFNLTTASCGWQNAVGGTGVVIISTGDPCEVRWPTETGSGYQFDPLAPQVGLSVGVPFTLGTYTHFNEPIPSGTAITSIELSLTTALDFNGGVSPTFTFVFNHNETPNAGPCPVGDPPCADIVTFPSAFPTETFLIDGTAYTMQLLGFGDSPGTLVSEFVSPEGGANDVLLWARITQARAVPEPSAGSLLLLGLLGALGRPRRRKTSEPGPV